MKMIRNTVIMLAMISLLALAGGCAKKDNASDQNTGQADYKAKAFTAALMAEDKCNMLFAKSTDKDGNPILTVKSRDEAEKILNGYMDQALTAKVRTHYLTGQKSEDSLIASKDAFFKTGLLSQRIADVAFSGSENDVTIKTKGNATYEVKKMNDKYVLANFSE